MKIQIKIPAYLLLIKKRINVDNFMYYIFMPFFNILYTGQTQSYPLKVCNKTL